MLTMKHFPNILAFSVRNNHASLENAASVGMSFIGLRGDKCARHCREKGPAVRE
jgi:hypothetical protein